MLTWIANASGGADLPLGDSRWVREGCEGSRVEAERRIVYLDCGGARGFPAPFPACPLAAEAAALS